MEGKTASAQLLQCALQISYWQSTLLCISPGYQCHGRLSFLNGAVLSSAANGFSAHWNGEQPVGLLLWCSPMLSPESYEKVVIVDSP